jgi:2-dehydropantoate 2-reductase
MRYIIIGAGAIGAAIGARLAETGREVVLVARGAHAAAMRADGLHVAIPERVITVKLPVVETVQDLSLRADDALMLCVKSQDAAPLVAALAVQPVGDTIAGAVLPLFCVQNGISNEPHALRLFRHVHGVAVMLSATHLEPGQVTAWGSPVTGILEIGRFPSGFDAVDEEVAADLNASGFIAGVREDVIAWKRAKLVRNLRNALEAFYGRGAEVGEDVTLDLIRARAVAEAHECFAAAGLTVVGQEEWNTRPGRNTQKQVAIGDQKRPGGSTWQSIKRGLGTVETDYLNGEIVLLGRLYGIPTPVNERIQIAMANFVRRRGEAAAAEPEQLLMAG